MSTSGMDLLIKALLDGDQTQAVSSGKELRKAGVSLEQIVREGVEKAMEMLDAKCTVEQFNLLEIMLAGRSVMAVMKELFPPDAPPLKVKGTVVIASLEGDVHDLGKNILKMVLTGKAYKVIDCGKDCPVEKLINAAEKNNADVVGVSGLITTVIPTVRKIRGLLKDRGLAHIKIIGGGAALKQTTAENLNVDYVAESAFDGAGFLEEILMEGQSE